MANTKDILEQLKSEDTELIREGAFQAAETMCMDAIPLLAALLKTQHLGVQEAADHALRKLGGQDTVKSVIPLLHSEEAPVRNLSMDILREVGGQDFPSLVDLVRDQDPDIRIFATDILGSTDNPLAVTPLCEALLKDPEVNVRYQAAVSLGDLAKPEAARCLNKALTDEEWVQYAVIESLSKIKHTSSVAALAKALNRASDLVASMIIDALGEMGNIQAVTMLLKRMDDSPTVIRNKIVKAIVQILGGKSLTLLSKDERENFRQYMLIALQDEDEEIQDAAIQGLAFIGGEDATRQILKIAAGLDEDHDHDRLERAIKSLASIGFNAALDDGLNSKDNSQAAVAAEVMGSIQGPEGSKALMKAFQGKDRNLQRMIISALLEGAGAEAKDFFLNILTTHKDGTILKGALQFLGEKMRFNDVSDKLFDMLDHEYDDVKEAALNACVAIDGEDMNRRFKALADDIDPLKRLMAAYALGEMGNPDNLEILKQSLEDEIPDIRKVALEAVSAMCKDDGEWMNIVSPRLQDESSEVRLALTELLGKRYSDDTAPHLVQALQDDDDWVRIRAIEALGAHMESSAAPHLIPLLENANKLLVIKVIEALGNIGGTAAFRSLLDIANSDDPELVQAGEEAILKIQEQQGDDR